MKIAIHSSGSREFFSEQWIDCCKRKSIPYCVVNCYDSDIIEQLEDCTALMWHFHHLNAKDVKFAKQLLYSLQCAGKKVFPDANSMWHFDDKVGQKYLLESIGAPLVPSYVFYTKKEALKWIERTTFPKVFKLRTGAGGRNVKLIETKKQARKLAHTAFGRGFNRMNPRSDLKERWYKYGKGDTDDVDVVRGLGRFVYPSYYARMMNRERGYIYFQDFLPDLGFDIRAKVLQDRCWAFKRIVRENDFRASGSNQLVFSKDTIPASLIKLSFDLAERLKLQSVAFDFLTDSQGIPSLIELSYGFGYDEEENTGYWDRDLNWHEERFNPFERMVDLVVQDSI